MYKQMKEKENEVEVVYLRDSVILVEIENRQQ
jgi:hypothetical protein